MIPNPLKHSHILQQVVLITPSPRKLEDSVKKQIHPGDSDGTLGTGHGFGGLALGPGFLSSRLCGLDKAPCLCFPVSRYRCGGNPSIVTPSGAFETQGKTCRGGEISARDGWDTH